MSPENKLIDWLNLQYLLHLRLHSSRGWLNEQLFNMYSDNWILWQLDINCDKLQIVTAVYISG